jgi:hypothetical protein
MPTRNITYEVGPCPRCSSVHALPLLVRYREDRVVLFGGKGSNTADSKGERASASVWEISFTCPETSERALAEVEIAPDEGTEIVQVSLSSTGDEEEPAKHMAAVAGGASAEPELARTQELSPGNDHAGSELTEWIKASISTPRDYCKSMLTASTAAIPIVFTVLKFLGVGTASSAWAAWSGVVPASLMVAAAVLFALAMRPEYVEIKIQEFPEWHRRRLRHMNTFIRWASAMFVLGLVTAIVVFALAIAETAPQAGD